MQASQPVKIRTIPAASQPQFGPRMPAESSTPQPYSAMISPTPTMDQPAIFSVFRALIRLADSVLIPRLTGADG